MYKAAVWIGLYLAVALHGQTTLAAEQVRGLPLVSPPEILVYWPSPGQLSYYLAPGTNPNIAVAVFLNGSLLTDASSGGFHADYSVSADKRTVTLSSYYKWVGNGGGGGRDILQVWAWKRGN